MASPHRQFQPQGIYHVYNRGNRKQPIFHDQADYSYFLDKLTDNCAKYDIKILAYCLMKNHYHLLLRQEGEESVTRAMLATGVSYVKRFNKKYSFVGHLFQERFRAIHVADNAYLAQVSRYIHLNPAEFTDYQTYPWSSFRAHLGQDDPICDPSFVLNYFNDNRLGSYADFVQAGAATPGVEQLITPGVA